MRGEEQTFRLSVFPIYYNFRNFAGVKKDNFYFKLLNNMVNYKDLGLVNTREMFKRAVAGGYAIPAFNFNTS